MAGMMNAAVVHELGRPLMIEDMPVPRAIAKPRPFQLESLDDINDIFGRLRDGRIDGRVVIRIRS